MGAISLCMTASRDAASVRAKLALARPVVDEIVLGVDRRAADEILAACGDLVDRPYVYEYENTIERYVAWLHHRCTGDWILRLDDDELPGSSLLGLLPELADDRRRAVALLPRRHLFPTLDRYIVSHPWFPDYQPRLVRNVPGLWTFAGHNHSSIEVLGERRRVPEAAMYHLHFSDSDWEARLATARRRERTIPGLLTEDYPVNALSVPELWTNVDTAEVPPDDRRLIARVSEPDPVRAGPHPAAEPMRTDDADRLLTNRAVSSEAYSAEIAISTARRTLAAGTVAHLEVQVPNTGSGHWPPAHQPTPPIRLAYRWLEVDGEAVVEPEGLRTPFEETVRPGELTVAMLAVRVPDQPGPYLLEVDVVHELVRWFDCASRLEVTVEPMQVIGGAGGLARPDLARISL